jgi:hypothetical protein
MKKTIKGLQEVGTNPKENIVLLVDADSDSEAIVSEAAAGTGRDVLLAKTSRDAFRILGGTNAPPGPRDR